MISRPSGVLPMTNRFTSVAKGRDGCTMLAFSKPKREFRFIGDKSMATVRDLNVTCADPRATGYAAEGEYNDGGATIVAAITWNITGKNPLMGPHELQLLQKECQVVSGSVENKRLSPTGYRVTNFAGKGI